MYPQPRQPREARRDAGDSFSLRVSRRNQLCQHLDPGLWPPAVKKPSSLWLFCYLALGNRYSKKSVTPRSLDVTPEGTQNHRGLCCRHVQGPAMCFRKRTLAPVQGGAPLYPKWSQDLVCQDKKQVCRIKLQFRNTVTLEQLGSYGCQPSWQSKILI